MLIRRLSACNRVTRSALFSCSLLLAACAILSARAQAQSTSSKQDENCLACHGQAGMTSATGKSIFVDSAKHAASLHGVLACNDCHTTIKDYPHPAKIPKVQCSTCHSDEAAALPNSIHSALGEQACQSCHGNTHEVKAATDLAPKKCAECHADEVKEFRDSIHGQAAAKGDPDAPKCVSCHGPMHQIQTAGDASSPVAKKKLPDTCASCHSNKDFFPATTFPSPIPSNNIAKACMAGYRQGPMRLEQVARIAMAAMESFLRAMPVPRSITGIFRQPAANATEKWPRHIWRACTDKR